MIEFKITDKEEEDDYRVALQFIRYKSTVVSTEWAPVEQSSDGSEIVGIYSIVYYTKHDYFKITAVVRRDTSEDAMVFKYDNGELYVYSAAGCGPMKLFNPEAILKAISELSD